MVKKIFGSPYFYLLLILIIGLLLRLYCVSITQNLMAWDSFAYHNQAKNMLMKDWGVEYNDHNSGYGFFLFTLYSVFGPGNYRVVYLFQVVIDLVVAFLIYRISLKVFNAKAGFISATIYLLNPLTASYTGLILPEILTMFYIVCLAYILVNNRFTTSKIMWFLTGLLLGLILFTRMSFIIFSLFFLMLSCVLFFRGKRRIFFMTLAGAGFLLASAYTLLGNYQKYRVVSLTPPYSIGPGVLYMNFYNDRYPELMKDIPQNFNQTYYAINQEYHTSYYLDIPKFREKYSRLFWEKMHYDWPVFIRNCLRNIVWMWDKEHLFAYIDPFYPQDTWPLRIANVSLIILFLIGLGKSLKLLRPYGLGIFQCPPPELKSAKAENSSASHDLSIGEFREGGLKDCLKQSPKGRLAVFSLTLFLYITFFFSLVTNETRHTVCFYPILFLWAGYGIDIMLNQKLKIKSQN